MKSTVSGSVRERAIDAAVRKIESACSPQVVWTRRPSFFVFSCGMGPRSSSP